MKIVIVTACPSGIANSIIAAGLLEKASAELGWSAVVECHNQLSEPRLLTSAEIAAADLVVVAGADVDLARFHGKRLYQAAVTAALPDSKQFLQTAEQAAVPYTHQVPSKETAMSMKRIVAITACPTGVAHTFMAAEAIEGEAKKRGYWVKVETRGSVGA